MVTVVVVHAVAAIDRDHLPRGAAKPPRARSAWRRRATPRRGAGTRAADARESGCARARSPQAAFRRRRGHRGNGRGKTSGAACPQRAGAQREARVAAMAGGRASTPRHAQRWIQTRTQRTARASADLATGARARSKRKGLRARSSPMCTLSQNGYGSGAACSRGYGPHSPAARRRKTAAGTQRMATPGHAQAGRWDSSRGRAQERLCACTQPAGRFSGPARPPRQWPRQDERCCVPAAGRCAARSPRGRNGRGPGLDPPTRAALDTNADAAHSACVCRPGHGGTAAEQKKRLACPQQPSVP